jgi:hypothetical protein
MFRGGVPNESDTPRMFASLDRSTSVIGIETGKTGHCAIIVAAKESTMVKYMIKGLR